MIHMRSVQTLRPSSNIKMLITHDNRIQFSIGEESGSRYTYLTSSQAVRLAHELLATAIEISERTAH